MEHQLGQRATVVDAVLVAGVAVLPLRLRHAGLQRPFRARTLLPLPSHPSARCTYLSAFSLKPRTSIITTLLTAGVQEASMWLQAGALGRRGEMGGHVAA